MILKEKEFIDLNKPVNSYLKGKTNLLNPFGNSDEITIRHLLQHRSGLPPHGRCFFSDEKNKIPDIAETISRYGFASNPVNERYTYSNLAYGILAYITSLVCNQSYPEFMKKELFEPLGLKHTTVEINTALGITAAKIYADSIEIPYYTFDEWGSGRIWSTPHDLVLFGLFHLKEHLPFQKPVISDETIDQMVNDNHTTGKKGGFYDIDWFYGLGWAGREKSDYGYKWYGHEGGMQGVSAQLKIFPEQRIVIAVASNERSPLTYNLISEIENILIKDYIELKKKDPTTLPKPKTVEYKVAADLLGEWKGFVRVVEDSIPVLFKFQEDNDMHIKLGEDFTTIMNNVMWEENKLSGESFGNISTEDTDKYPHTLWFNLTRRDNHLSRSVSAFSQRVRLHFYLPFWIDLIKEEK